MGVGEQVGEQIDAALLTRVSGSAYDPPRHETASGGAVDEANEATGATGNAAALAAAVLDEEAARQEAQARAKEQVIFPDDMLPGVESEPVDFKEAFARGGKLMFIVLGLLVSFDQLTLGAVQTIEPELIHTFHISKGTVVFISTASGLFFALGAIPLGWLADRMKRVPIVGVTSVLGAFFTFVTGAAVSAFMLFWMVCFTGITKANDIAVHPSLIADNYPIGIRADVCGDEPRPADPRESQPAARRRRRDRRPAARTAGAGPSSFSVSQPRSSL